jgi:hypothetical protein
VPDEVDRAKPSSRGRQPGSGASPPGSGGRRPDGRVDGRAAAAVAEPHGGKQRHTVADDRGRRQREGAERQHRQHDWNDRGQPGRIEEEHRPQDREDRWQPDKALDRRGQAGGRQLQGRDHEHSGDRRRREPGSDRGRPAHAVRQYEQPLRQGSRGEQDARQHQQRGSDRWQPDEEDGGGRWGDDDDADRGHQYADKRDSHRGGKDMDRSERSGGAKGDDRDRRHGREQEQRQAYGGADRDERDYRAAGQRGEERHEPSSRGRDVREGRARLPGSPVRARSDSSGRSGSSDSRGGGRGSRVPLRRGHARSHSRSLSRDDSR